MYAVLAHFVFAMTVARRWSPYHHCYGWCQNAMERSIQALAKIFSDMSSFFLEARENVVVEPTALRRRTEARGYQRWLLSPFRHLCFFHLRFAISA